MTRTVVDVVLWNVAGVDATIGDVQGVTPAVAVEVAQASIAFVFADVVGFLVDFVAPVVSMTVLVFPLLAILVLLPLPVFVLVPFAVPTPAPAPVPLLSPVLGLVFCFGLTRLRVKVGEGGESGGRRHA